MELSKHGPKYISCYFKKKKKSQESRVIRCLGGEGVGIGTGTESGMS